MLTSIKTYLMGALLSLLLTVGGYGYYAHGQIEKLTLDVSTYKDAAESNLKAKENADASCLITVESLSEHYRKQAELESSQDATGDAILALPTLTIKEKANAAPNATHAVKVPQPADDDRLSPDLMRLLDDAYCYGDKDGCTATAK